MLETEYTDGSEVRNPSTPPRASVILELLRIGLGLVWAANLLFILDPANEFFPTFQATAQSYAPTTITGPSLPELVAAFPLPFALGIALITFFMAFAFLFGSMTKLGCLVGCGFSAILLVTQWSSTFYIPGGTDVGPQPLYLLIDGALYFGGAGQLLTLRTWISRNERVDLSALASAPASRASPASARPSQISVR
jgi:hypothetical protein